MKRHLDLFLNGLSVAKGQDVKALLHLVVRELHEQRAINPARAQDALHHKQKPSCLPRHADLYTQATCLVKVTEEGPHFLEHSQYGRVGH